MCRCWCRLRCAPWRAESTTWSLSAPASPDTPGRHDRTRSQRGHAQRCGHDSHSRPHSGVDTMATAGHTVVWTRWPQQATLRCGHDSHSRPHSSVDTMATAGHTVVWTRWPQQATLRCGHDGHTHSRPHSGVDTMATHTAGHTSIMYQSLCSGVLRMLHYVQ